MAFVQADRPLSVKTQLGPDDFLVTGFRGSEGLSQLFRFEVEVLAENSTTVSFDKLLGQGMSLTLHLPEGKSRYFSGIASRISQGDRDLRFTQYRVEMVPAAWLLTRRTQSRTFQQITVPDILKKVLAGLDVAFEIVGTFQPRDYCVQYRETDFQFASRLMEEEGIYYFFKHSADGHKMVIANSPQSHTDLPVDAKIIFEEAHGGFPEGERIYEWTKSQELRSGKVTLWDHCFELPHKHLEAEKATQDSVQVGRVTHKLKLANNDKLELYDYPGAYAQRFDGVNKGGGDNPSDIQKIFDDNKRTVEIRMQEETANALTFSGASNCRHLVSGHKFELAEHFSDDGKYVLTGLSHAARQPVEMGDNTEPFRYENSFTCIPVAVPFRPQRNTPRPVVRGTQTAVVVGPSGEEIFTDKYGRVKVQFHWDREGKNDVNSSCWIRVSTHWAGNQWGIIHIPRVGQEVVVDFLEGDPDQPIIVGSVYNAKEMPPYALPDNKTVSGIRSRSTKDASNDMLNEIRFEDKKDSEDFYMQAQKDMDVRVKHDRKEWIGNDAHLNIDNDSYTQVKRDEHVEIQRDRFDKMQRDSHVTIGGKSAVSITGSHSVKVGGDVAEQFGANHSEQCSANLYLKAMNIVIEAGTQLSLRVGGNHVPLGPAGVFIVGSPMVFINSGGAAGTGNACNLVAATVPKKSAMPLDTKATAATILAAAAGAGAAGAGAAAAASPAPSPAAPAPTHDPHADENKEKKNWVAVEFVDEAGQPVAGEVFEIKLPDGSVYTGTTDEKGQARVDHIDPGSVDISFPNLDKDAWEPA